MSNHIGDIKRKSLYGFSLNILPQCIVVPCDKRIFINNVCP